jgi:hypothetical protein
MTALTVIRVGASDNFLESYIQRGLSGMSILAAHQAVLQESRSDDIVILSRLYVTDAVDIQSF